MSTAQAITYYQPLLQRIAYNLVRCRHDAEDIVQETFAKWLIIDHKKIENTKAYLIKAVTNNCLNHLAALKRKKEEYLDSLHLPQFLTRFVETNLSHLDVDVNLGAAFKILCTKLEPLERAVYLLKEVFDFDYNDLQQALDKKKDHCRQLFCRAQKKLSEEKARLYSELPGTAQMVDTFKQACSFGNATELVQHLRHDIARAVRKKSKK
jgi:RNA polymerase sigma-70 factor (ECF subfamily)